MGKLRLAPSVPHPAHSRSCQVYTRFRDEASLPRRSSRDASAFKSIPHDRTRYIRSNWLALHCFSFDLPAQILYHSLILCSICMGAFNFAVHLFAEMPWHSFVVDLLTQMLGKYSFVLHLYVSCFAFN